MQTNGHHLPQALLALDQHLQHVEASRTPAHLAALKAYLADTPSLRDQAQVLSDEIEERLLFYLASGEETKKAQLKAEMTHLTAQLLGHETPHIAEQLLAHELVVSLLLTRFSDTKLLRHYDQASSVQMRKMDAIHTRLMRSLKTYLAVKKAIPEFAVHLTQVNLG